MEEVMYRATYFESLITYLFACMLKELRSFVDGHHEYEMTCAPSEHCDGGSGLSIAFGRRELESRDLSVSCCTTDNCNYPAGAATPPTVSAGTVTGCPKDIVFLVDEGSRDLHSHHNDILLGIATVVSSIPVGASQNHVALVAYSNQVSPKFDLDDHTNQASLLQSLKSSDILVGKNMGSDATMAIEYLVHNTFTPSRGDRSQFINTVVIITDSDSAPLSRIMFLDHAVLASKSRDVLVVSVGPSMGSNAIEELGDSVVHINNSPNLSSDLAAQILAFLKHC
ncbi:collagen alpha-3(VI) chain-like [Dreissena polymorpha]|uniref:collagen alpha-3(VI) chain-like n=1 Tax=Dreissena polymorpha TaxID=45954 RepID=UPI002264F423|nr:collagen alpha-3(VI) chain-like [Dreissena polymorpha]